MDLYEKDNAIIFKAELPGLKKEDVEVQMEGEDLIMRGESEVKDEDYYRSERSYGSFYRRMPLSAGVTPEQIQANLKDGRARGARAQTGRGQGGGQEIAVK